GTYGWGQLMGIAIQTASGLCLIGVGFLVIAWNMARHPGEFTPRWLPLPVAIGSLTASLVFYFALESNEELEIARTVKAHAEWVRNQVATRMDYRFRAIVRMSKRWEFSGASAQAGWEADAANYVHDFPDIQALQWIDAAHRIQWMVPLAGNEARLDL